MIILIAGITDRTAIRLVDVHRNMPPTFSYLRKIIAYELEKENEELLEGEIGADEELFQKGKEG